MSFRFGAHWASRKFHRLREFGLDFVWVNPDTLMDPAYAEDTQALLAANGPFFILEPKFTSESKLLNLDQSFITSLHHAKEILHPVRGKLLGVQLDDEFYSNFSTSAGRWDPAQWPSVPRGSRTSWVDLLPAVAAQVEQRIRDVREVFGSSAFVGMAETGGIIPPRTNGLDWWGINGYLGKGRPDPASIHRLYAEIDAFTPLPIMPVFGIYEDSTSIPLPPLTVLASAYLPILSLYARKIWSVGLFCLHHPSQWATPGVHVKGRGILELPESYQTAVKWATSEFGLRTEA